MTDAPDPPTDGLAPPRYRLPDDTVVGPVRLQVSDADRSVAWYRDTLGLDLLSRDGDRAMLGVGRDGTALVELHAAAGVRPVPRGGLLGLYHFAILLPDRPALGRLLRHLSDRDLRVGAADHLVSEALYLTDPDGLGIEVYADRPRDSWRHRDGQLVMASDPLDAAAVVASAGATAWDGMPAGTTMGHVHLHVGDLGQAERFYHAALGFDRTVWSYPGALFLAAGGYHHHLGVNTWARGAAPAGAGDARLLEWTLMLPGWGHVREAAASLESAGHAVTTDGGAVLAPDPWGTVLRLDSLEQ